MRIARQLGFVLAAATPLALAVIPAAGQVSSGPAALIVFPHVVVDAEVDTVVQLNNASNEPIGVRCVYRDFFPDCDGVGSCLLSPLLCDGSCVEPRVTLFRVRLTANQPLGWSVARGLTEGPLPSNVGTRVPAVDAGVFQGTLRCVVVDGNGHPTDQNVLAGMASIESRAASPTHGIDAAQYNAIGLAAVAGANDGDEFLRLGGAQAEYAACPGSLVLPNLFDFATVRTGVSAGTVGTTIAVTPCGGDALGDGGLGATMHMLMYNEFGQRVSSSLQIEGHLVSPLSLLDTTQPDRSIFSVGAAGTLSGQLDFTGIGGGLIGIAVQAHTDLLDPASRHRAATHLAGEGAFASPEAIALLQPPCQCDCSGDGRVAIDELVLAINGALAAVPVDACPASDADASGTVTIDELMGGIVSALSACPERGMPPTPAPEETPPPTLPAPTEPGPDIVHLGIASGDDAPQEPSGVDDQGRPIYTWPVGQGFTLIVEARPGSTRAAVGFQAASPNEEMLPDLQMIVSRPLGDGNATVCDADLPTPGGVPAVVPLEFGPAPEVVHAINDLGCRSEDGYGLPMGRRSSNPCTRIPPANDAAFVRSRGATQAQFCVPIARAWAFPEGDTVVAVRVRDIQGTTGAVREMVIRIAAGP